MKSFKLFLQGFFKTLVIFAMTIFFASLIGHLIAHFINSSHGFLEMAAFFLLLLAVLGGLQNM